MREYIVKSGDGWYKIAKNTGINVNDLLKLNNANLNTVIHPGQKLKLISKQQKPKSTTPSQPQSRKTSSFQPVSSDVLSTGPSTNVLRMFNRDMAQQVEAERQAQVQQMQERANTLNLNLGATRVLTSKNAKKDTKKTTKNTKPTTQNTSQEPAIPQASPSRDESTWDRITRTARNIATVAPYIPDVLFGEAPEGNSNEAINYYAARNFMRNGGLPGIVATYVGKQYTNPIYDNIYGYSYGDKESKDGRFRQITGNDSYSEQLEGMAKKFANATKGMDPRRELMEQLVQLDLSSPEGLAKWKEMTTGARNKGMVRVEGGNPINNQWELRARLDAMDMYQGRPQRWNTFVEQSDPARRSGMATREGKPTFIIKDEAQRKRLMGELHRYWLNNKDKVVVGEDGVKRLPVMTYLGNGSLMPQSDGSVRYVDNWDYKWSSPNDVHRPWFGDIVTDYEPTSTVGRNVGGMSESAEDLIWEAIKENGGKEIMEGISNIGQAIQHPEGFTAGMQNIYTQHFQPGLQGLGSFISGFKKPF